MIDCESKKAHSAESRTLAAECKGQADVGKAHWKDKAGEAQRKIEASEARRIADLALAEQQTEVVRQPQLIADKENEAELRIANPKAESLAAQRTSELAAAEDKSASMAIQLKCELALTQLQRQNDAEKQKLELEKNDLEKKEVELRAELASRERSSSSLGSDGGGVHDKFRPRRPSVGEPSREITDTSDGIQKFNSAARMRRILSSTPKRDGQGSPPASPPSIRKSKKNFGCRGSLRIRFADYAIDYPSTALVCQQSNGA